MICLYSYVPAATPEAKLLCLDGVRSIYYIDISNDGRCIIYLLLGGALTVTVVGLEAKQPSKTLNFQLSNFQLSNYYLRSQFRFGSLINGSVGSLDKNKK